MTEAELLTSEFGCEYDTDEAGNINSYTIHWMLKDGRMLSLVLSKGGKVMRIVSPYNENDPPQSWLLHQ